MVGLWHVGSRCGHPGGHARPEGPAPRRHDGMTFICAGSASCPGSLRGRRDAERGGGGAAAAQLRAGQSRGDGAVREYVATLHKRALREGTSALVRKRGRPGEPARRLGAGGAVAGGGGGRREIARRLGVNQSTVLRRLGRAPCRTAARRRAGRRAGAAGRGRHGTGRRPGLRAGEPGRAGSGPGRAMNGGHGPEPGACAGAQARSRAGRRSGPGGRRQQSRAPGWPAGMRGRCCSTPTWRGSGRGRS